MKLLNYYNLKRFVLFLIILISNNVVYSQNDSKKSATTASILSIACPGLGQIYNKKYWKAPIIYAGLGSTMYYYYHNNDKYNLYKSAYIAENVNASDGEFIDQIVIVWDTSDNAESYKLYRDGIWLGLAQSDSELIYIDEFAVSIIT